MNVPRFSAENALYERSGAYITSARGQRGPGGAIPQMAINVGTSGLGGLGWSWPSACEIKCMAAAVACNIACAGAGPGGYVPCLVACGAAEIACLAGCSSFIGGGGGAGFQIA